MIKLENLSTRQVALCELMWEMKSLRDVDNFIAALPVDFQKDAETMKLLMVFAVVEEDLDQTQDVSRAQEILERY